VSALRLNTPTVAALSLLGAFFLHQLGYLVWLLIDHDGAMAWMRALGMVVFTHCWGEDGWSSHWREVEEVGIASGGGFAALALPCAVVGAMRAHGPARCIATSLVVTCVALVAPAAIVLWLVTHTPARPPLPRSWHTAQLRAAATPAFPLDPQITRR
jgi:hypothetical protein